MTRGWVGSKHYSLTCKRFVPLLRLECSQLNRQIIVQHAIELEIHNYKNKYYPSIQ